ncbi:MAG TPA: phosphate ABC transporter permease subunit PstC [Candidatus Binataceae bacterium]|nr:phosphate ABC transporter permease subunit PstC [Candidatus Binataceae bacterium]
MSELEGTVTDRVAVIRREATKSRAEVRLFGDRIFNATTYLLAMAILALLAGLALSLIFESIPSIRAFGANFFFSSQWDPVNDQYGALPFIYGTFVSSFLALLIAVPLSLGVALCLSEMAPDWLSHRLGFLVDLLAAIPSVVYGLWAVFVMGPWIRDYVEPLLSHLFGFIPLFQGPKVAVGMLSAGVILAIMIIPYISSVCTDVFRVVPHTQREAALALGATKWEMVNTAVIPYGMTGVIGAIILGLGRALGETIAVAMVIGNSPEISASLFKPAATLASVIANEFAEATSDLYVSALVELGLVLLVMGIALNIVARALVQGVRQRRFQEGAK